MRDYLSRVAPPGGLPGRQAVDPTVFKALLPFINLVDVIRRPDGLDFRFRLVGTLQTSVAGREITGRHVEEAVLPQFVDRIRANMMAAVEHRSEEHTSELQSLMRISYAVFCLKKKTTQQR